MRRGLHGTFWCPLVIVLGIVLGGCSASVSPAPSTAALGDTGTGGAGSGASGGTTTGNATAVDACSLLTPAEIQSAIGVAVKDGVPNKTDTASQCEWDSQDDSAGVSLSVATYDDTLYKTLGSAKDAVPVSGIGESAFKGIPHAGDLAIKQGGDEIDLGIVDFTLDPAKVDAADLTLAKLVLSRI